MSVDFNPYTHMTEFETQLEAALEYAEAGIPVFPCGAAANSKAPRVAGGFKVATTDKAQIRRWWTDWPEAPIGVPTGAASGWTVVDVDPRNGGDHTLDELKVRHGVDWTDTRTHITGSGGLHFVFAHDPRMVRCATEILPGIDIKDEGGYVIVPPSQPAGYGRYSTKVEDTLAAQPEWLGALRSKDETERAVAPKPTADVSPVDIDKQVVAAVVGAYWNNGKRNRLNMATAAYLYGAGWTRAAVERTMDLIYRDTGDEDEANRRDNVRRTLDRMDEGRPVAGASALHQDFPDLLRALDSQLGRERPPIPEKKHRLGLYSEDELAAIPTPVPLIADVLDAGLTVVYGPPKSCKTFAVLGWAVSVASGKPWLGHEVEQGPVVYNLSEGVGKLRFRITEAKRELGVVDQKIPLYVVPRSLQLMHEAAGVTSDVAGLIASIRETLGEQNPRLIVVDTLARSMPGGDENHQKDMNALVAGCTALMHEFGCSVILVHHTGVSGERMRGSSVLPGAVDMAWGVEKRNDTLVEMATDLRKDGEDLKLRLKIEVVTIRDKEGVPVRFPVPGGKGTKEEKTVVLRATTPYEVVADDDDSGSDAKILRAMLVAGWVEGNPATSRSIVEKSKTPRSTLHRRLEKKLVPSGFVGNKSSGRDGYYHITEKGREWVETLDKARESHVDSAAFEAATAKE